MLGKLKLSSEKLIVQGDSELSAKFIKVNQLKCMYDSRFEKKMVRT